MPNTLEEFNEDFKKYLSKKGLDGFSMKYVRPYETSTLAAWCQENFDKLGIREIEYELKDGVLNVKNIVYDPMGRPICPYEITYKSNINSPDEIESIRLRLIP